MGKDSIMGFLLKQKNEPDISSVNDTAEKTITNLLKQQKLRRQNSGLIQNQKGKIKQHKKNPSNNKKKLW